MSGIVGLWSQTGNRPIKVLKVCKGKRLIFIAVIVHIASSGLWRRAVVASFSGTFVLHYAVSQTRETQSVGEEQCCSSMSCNDSTVFRVKSRVMAAQSVG